MTSTPAQDAATWEKTVRKLRTRQMPPPGMPKPDEATYRALTSSIEHELDQLAAAKPNLGRTGAGGLTVGARARLRAGEFAELG